jgi:hypothetical protein
LARKSETKGSLRRFRRRWEGYIKTTLKIGYTEEGVMMITVFIWLRLDPVAFLCKLGNEPSGCIKGEEFLISF